MPLLKPDALRFSHEEIEALRARLVEPYSSELVAREGRRYLFARCPGEPDPVVSLERALAQAPASSARELDDVFLLGDRGDLHVPTRIARAAAQAQLVQDEEAAQGARAMLDPTYGVRLHRFTMDPLDVQRLLVRVPHERCAQVTEADLVQLAERIGPLNDAGKLRNVPICHLVADEDGLRFRATEFLGDLLDRWLPIREARNAPPMPEPEPLAPVPPLPMPEPRLPRRVEDVTPLFDIQVEIDARIPEASDALRAAAVALVAPLQNGGYEVRTPPGSPFALEAERASAHPRRVAALLWNDFDRPQADEAVRLMRDHALDVLLVICDHATPAGERRVATTNVRLVKAHAAGDLRL